MEQPSSPPVKLSVSQLAQQFEQSIRQNTTQETDHGSAVSEVEHAPSKRLSIVRLARPESILVRPTHGPSISTLAATTASSPVLVIPPSPSRPESALSLNRASSTGSLHMRFSMPPPRPAKPPSLAAPSLFTANGTSPTPRSPYLPEEERHTSNSSPLPQSIPLSQRIAALNAASQRPLFPSSNQVHPTSSSAHDVYAYAPSSVDPWGDTESQRSYTGTYNSYERPSSVLSNYSSSGALPPKPIKKIAPPPPPSLRSKRSSVLSLPKRPSISGFSEASLHQERHQATPTDHWSHRVDRLVLGSDSPDLPVEGAERTATASTSSNVYTESGGEDKVERMKRKRSQIVAEIVDTERQYLDDLRILREVFVVPAIEAKALPPGDIKVLFGNLDAVIETAELVVSALEDAIAKSPDPEGQPLGSTFLSVLTPIERAYCEYCKHNEACVAKLGEYVSPECPEEIKAFLKERQAQLVGRTLAWDLASLVIKPVQRVLKYPLLLRELIKETQSAHPDYATLVEVQLRFERIATNINEVKKRKDIVDKYIEKKGNVNVIHGINKKFVRGTEMLKQKTGLSGDITLDSDYDRISTQFGDKATLVAVLKRDIAAWNDAVSKYVKAQESVYLGLEDIYKMNLDSADTRDLALYPSFQLLLDYRREATRVSSEVIRDAEKLSDRLVDMLDQLSAVFREPLLLMKKRNEKLLDFDRVRAIRAKGETPDSFLEQSAAEYPSINAQLIEELPLLTHHAQKYVGRIFDMLMVSQARIYVQLTETLAPIWENASVGTGAHWRSDDIVLEFQEAFRIGCEAEQLASQIDLLSSWWKVTWPEDRHPLEGRQLERTGSVHESPFLKKSLTSARESAFQFLKGGSGNNPRHSIIRVPKFGRKASTNGSDPGEPRSRSTSLDGPYPSPGPSSDRGTVHELPKPEGMRVSFYVRALYDHEPQNSDELELAESQIVHVEFIADDNAGWWLGRHTDESGPVGPEGWFPRDYVECIDTTS